MVTHAELFISLAVAIFGSTGLWSLVQYLIQRRDTRESAESQLIKGLAHDRICSLGEKYIKQGFITQNQYNNINDYLYQPYRRLKVNGTAEKIMEEVKALPIQPEGDYV